MLGKVVKILCFGLLVLLLGIPALAQNTKGDKPAPTNRETRFKTPKKSSQKRKPGRRIKERADRPGHRAALPPTRTKGGERAGRPIRPTFEKSSPRPKQRAWKGDITGRRIRPRSSAGRAANIYPQPRNINYSSRSLKDNFRRNDNPMVKRVRRMQRQQERSKVKAGRPIRPLYSNRRPRHKEKAWTGDITGRRIPSPTTERARVGGGINRGVIQTKRRPRIPTPGVFGVGASGRARNLYTGKNFYVNNQSQKPARYRRPPNRTALMMLQQHRQAEARGRMRKVVPRSASAAYMAGKSPNVWAHFPRPKQRQERAITTDLAGKRLRTKNFETQRPILTNPTLKYERRMASGERPYKGRAAGGYVTRRPGQKAWKGDIAHWPLRGGKAPQGRMNAGTRLRGKAPGRGATGVAGFQGRIKANRRRGYENQGEEYSGNIRSRRILKGGGSISGRVWNNKGEPIEGKSPGKGSSGIGYQGNIHAARRGFNNQGEEYTGNIKTRGKRQFDERGERYSGNIRVNAKRGFRDQGEEYSGNIKVRRGFNNQGEEYRGNINVGRRRGFNDQGEEYTGNIKARRPEKGGGSVSGKLWNNNETPIEGRIPRGQSQIARYQGNLRAGKKGFHDQGEEYSGNIKARRPEKGGGSVSGKLWNNNESPIEGRTPKSGQGGEFSGNIKLARNSFKRNPGSADAALPVYKEKNQQGGDFAGNLRLARGSLKRNPKSDDAALKVLKPSNATVKAGTFFRGSRRDWDYIKNPSTADASLRTKEPGRAFARSTDYQGSIKFKKFDLFGKSDLHPDAKFVKLNKNNVPEERDMITNFKLWWARLFRKNDTQPDNLKEKERKPRYDKGEAGMWYE